MPRSSRSRAPIVPEPDIDAGVAYWRDTVPATVDGVLGGFGTGTLPRVDQLGTRTFLLRVLPRLSAIPASHEHPLEWKEKKVRERGGPGRAVTRALDCGAGVGRVSEHSLLPIVDVVHLMEPVGKFIKEAARLSPTWAPLKASPSASPFQSRKAAHFHEATLQSFDPARPYTSSGGLRIAFTVSPADEGDETGDDGGAASTDEPVVYDVVCCQWMLQHVGDEDLLSFLTKARAALRAPDKAAIPAEASNRDEASQSTSAALVEEATRAVKEKAQEEVDAGAGIIFIKENTCTENADGTEQVIWDDEDSSITRSAKAYERVFSRAGLSVLRTEVQLGLPEGLFAVRMWALR